MVNLEPMAKPDIRDRKWKSWKQWGIALRAMLAVHGFRPEEGDEPTSLAVEAYFPIPQSYRGSNRYHPGELHRVKPDANHVWNAVADALYSKDERIALQTCDKRWTEAANGFMRLHLSWSGVSSRMQL